MATKGNVNRQTIWDHLEKAESTKSTLRDYCRRWNAKVIYKDDRWRDHPELNYPDANMENIDKVRSAIAGYYSVLRAFPDRFEHSEVQGPDEHRIWGFTHEDWNRASTVVETYTVRRAKTGALTNSGVLGEPSWYGLIDDQVSAEVSDALASIESQVRLDAARYEDALLANDEELGEIGAMASNEDLVDLLGDALDGKIRRKPNGEIDDSDGTIAAHLAGNVYYNLSVISPRVDGAEHVKDQAKKRGAPIRPLCLRKRSTGWSPNASEWPTWCTTTARPAPPRRESTCSDRWAVCSGSSRPRSATSRLSRRKLA